MDSAHRYLEESLQSVHTSADFRPWFFFQRKNYCLDPCYFQKTFLWLQSSNCIQLENAPNCPFKICQTFQIKNSRFEVFPSFSDLTLTPLIIRLQFDLPIIINWLSTTNLNNCSKHDSHRVFQNYSPFYNKKTQGQLQIKCNINKLKLSQL